MVEGAPLLREYTRNGIVGSNPIFSAISAQCPHLQMIDEFGAAKSQRKILSGIPACEAFVALQICYERAQLGSHVPSIGIVEVEAREIGAIFLEDRH